MEHLDLARWQFAITTVYHFLFVPLSIGLAYLIAMMQTIYVMKNDETYKRMAQFWGKLFLLNFAVGVVTGILQEFQFGMNWSDFSRFVGDIFGGPLAVEALVSFFMESTFLGVWIFGWDRLSKKVHLLSIWLVAIGTTISAFWILTANAFMQQPVGYVIQNGRAEMNDFFALLMTKQLWTEFPHVLMGALATGAMFVAGISAFKLLRKQQIEVFKPSFQLSIMIALVASILVAVAGHDQAQWLVQTQPMKMAAAEALWNDSPDRAPWTVFASIDVEKQQNAYALEIPTLLSLLSYNKLEGKVRGIHEIQTEYELKYGPGNYIPPVKTTFWSFRVMIFAGTFMIVLAFYGAYFAFRGWNQQTWYLKWMIPAMSLPFIANSAGWIMTEIGRQPWTVFGVLKTSDSVSPTVSAGMIWTSLIGFTLMYGILATVLIFLFIRTIKQGAVDELQDGHGTSDEHPRMENHNDSHASTVLTI